jgi:RNA polymerase sigma factor (sigma-70 family)
MTALEGHWDRVVRAHSTSVYRLAYRLTGDPHDAENITQDVFVRVFTALPSSLQGNVDGRLHSVTAALFLELVRRQRTRFELAGNTPCQPLADQDRVLTMVEDEQTRDGEVQAALNALAPEVRAAVVLNDIAGLAHREIAAALGIKRGLVRRQIYHGRAQVHAGLNRCTRPGARQADTAALRETAETLLGAGGEDIPGALPGRLVDQPLVLSVENLVVVPHWPM